MLIPWLQGRPGDSARDQTALPTQPPAFPAPHKVRPSLCEEWVICQSERMNQSNHLTLQLRQLKSRRLATCLSHRLMDRGCQLCSQMLLPSTKLMHCFEGGGVIFHFQNGRPVFPTQSTCTQKPTIQRETLCSCEHLYSPVATRWVTVSCFDRGDELVTKQLNYVRNLQNHPPPQTMCHPMNPLVLTEPFGHGNPESPNTTPK